MINREEMDTFWVLHNITRLNQEYEQNNYQQSHWNLVIKKIPNYQKLQDQVTSQVNSTKHLSKS